MSGVMAIPPKRKMINIHENAFEMSKIQDSINNIMTTLMEMQDKYSTLEAKIVESNHKIETASLKDKVEELTNTVEGKIAKKKPGPKKDKPTVYNLYMKYKSNEMKESGELTDENYKQKWGECSKSWSKERDNTSKLTIKNTKISTLSIRIKELVGGRRTEMHSRNFMINY